MTRTMPYSQGPRSVVTQVRGLPPPAQGAFVRRLDTLARIVTGEQSLPLPDALDAIRDAVGTEADLLWLAHSVLAAELPTDDDVRDLLVRARLGGTWAALAPLLAAVADARQLRDVEVLRGAVTCDVHTTAGSDFLSGIQRVVRETAQRWSATRDLTFVGWVNDLVAFRELPQDHQHHRFGGEMRHDGAKLRAAPVVVPWESTHLWLEVVTELRRTSRLLAMTRYSRNQVGVLGYDSIPVTTSATVAQGMTSHFAHGLAAVRRADRVAMISDAAAREFRGVVDMGAGRRDQGPDVASVPLAVAASATAKRDLAEARAGLVANGLPMILVVGSHEPRKNHLAVLHAAELLWREGVGFNLVLVGAGGWEATEYDRTVASLLGANRPVQSIRGLPDRLLWAAYRLAHCTLFPSLNEGFGLPVAESLAAGTPVITSRFGSMRDIVAPHGTPLGGLLVDPRDDKSIAEAMRTMITDTATHQRLERETAQHTLRSWDEYADELWAYLVEGVRPKTGS